MRFPRQACSTSVGTPRSRAVLAAVADAGDARPIRTVLGTMLYTLGRGLGYCTACSSGMHSAGGFCGNSFVGNGQLSNHLAQVLKGGLPVPISTLTSVVNPETLDLVQRPSCFGREVLRHSLRIVVEIAPQ